MWSIHLCGDYPEHPLLFAMGNSSGKSRVSDHVAFETSPTPPIPNIVVHAATPLSTPIDPPGHPSFARYGSPTDGPEDPAPPPLPRTPPPPLPTSSNVRSSGRRPSIAQLGAAAAAAVRHKRDEERRRSRSPSTSSSPRRPSQPRLFKAPPIPVITTDDFSTPRRPDTLESYTSYSSYDKLASPPTPQAPPPTPHYEEKKKEGGMSKLEAFLARRRIDPKPVISSPVLQSRETMVFAPPPDLPPPLPALPPPPSSDEDSVPSPPLVSPVIAAPTPKPRDRKNIVYAKDRVAQFEKLNTTIRSEQSDDTMKIREPRMGNAVSKTAPDNYPIYNPIEDFSFSAGMQFQKGAFPIDTNRSNIAIVGRSGVGKSTLINALRGINQGDPQAAGRGHCEMEPFRFIEPSLHHVILWEVAYPKSFSTVSDIYDRNMSFNRFYDAHKLNNFAHVIVMIGDGAPTDDDIAFARVVKSRRTPLTLVLSKADIDIEAEARELNRPIEPALLANFAQNANRVFSSVLERKAPVLLSTPLLTVSAPVTRCLVSGTRSFLSYETDEERLLHTIGIQRGCHAELEAEQQRQLMTMGYASREQLLQGGDYEGMRNLQAVPSHPSVRPTAIHKSTVLADAGFEISYGTDDRVFGNMEPRTGVRRTGRTSFNYAFVGGKGVGKSSLINAMRGMTSKHPLAAGKGRAKAASVDKFEFDDEILKYSVTLWEMHYPRRVNNFFEFIDANNIASFTAIFVIVRDGIPSDEDLTFAKIAHRRSASVVLLSSRTDRRLAMRSRADEIPVCDLLKQRFIEKGVERFDRRMQSSAPELSGRVHLFFVSAPVFLALRSGRKSDLFLVHERAVFDFLKQKRIIADMLDLPLSEMKEGLYANVNLETAGVYPEDPVETREE